MIKIILITIKKQQRKQKKNKTKKQQQQISWKQSTSLFGDKICLNAHL